MKIALFGGTFDPPHRAHRSVAEAASEEFGLDQVWWIPSYEPPHKAERAITPFDHRLAMVRLAAAGNPAFRVKDFERKRHGPSYTVDTVRAVLEASPQDAFWLLIGEDSLQQFHSWRDPRHIVAQIPLIVYRRADSPVDTPVAPYLKGRVQYCEAPRIRIAGTLIREQLANDANVGNFVSDRVKAYIAKHGLYNT